MTRLAFFGSSILSSYWNGAATYYRGIVRALAAQGWDVTFHEPDVWGRQAHRDIDPPDWCHVHVWEGSPDGLCSAAARAAEAEVIVVASGIGYDDDTLRQKVLGHTRPGALRVWWDVDAPATLATLRTQPLHPLRRDLADFDLVLTYGGGDPVVRGYRDLGADACVPVYNALDPDTHFPVAPEPRFATDLAFLGNRLPDRDARVREFLFNPARACPDRRFLLGGSGWRQADLPANVQALGHVGTREHNAFNATPLAVLNVARDSMAEIGFSPATRIFEAAGAGACLITDAWEGIEHFLIPGREVLVARDGSDVAEMMSALTRKEARRIGRKARARLLSEHTYTHRARQAGTLFTRMLERKLHREALP